jgi:hypothetical protein
MPACMTLMQPDRPSGNQEGNSEDNLHVQYVCLKIMIFTTGGFKLCHVNPLAEFIL